MKPLISVITPVYNREAIVKKTIESVIHQSYPNWEYIIVDDCSEDNTWRVLRNYEENVSKIKSIQRNRSPKGAQTCRNIGLKAARGSFLIFLDSDDILQPHCLEQRSGFINENPDMDLAIFPKKNLDSCHRNKILDLMLRYRSPIQTTDALWSSSFLTQIQGFEESLTRFQDVELIIRALLQQNINFYCSTVHKPDSIYTYQAEISAGSNGLFISQSLYPFIEKVVCHLEKTGNDHQKSLLRYYLCSWLIHYYSRDLITEGIELVSLFQKKNIIPEWKAAILRKIFLNLGSRTSKKGLLRKSLFYFLFYK